MWRPLAQIAGYRLKLSLRWQTMLLILCVVMWDLSQLAVVAYSKENQGNFTLILGLIVAVTPFPLLILGARFAWTADPSTKTLADKAAYVVAVGLWFSSLVAFALLLLLVLVVGARG